MKFLRMMNKVSKARVKIGAGLTIVALLLGVGIITVLADTIGGFNIDGDVPDSGAYKFEDQFGKASELGPVNSNTTKLGVIHTALPPMLEYTNPNAQVDLRRVWLDTNVIDDEVWLYFAWERDSSKGSGVIMYEFQKGKPPAACDYDGTDEDLISSCNPWSNRSEGDFVIVWDQQGSTIDIILRTFVSDPTSSIVHLDEGVTLDPSVAKAAVSADGYFGEAAINLSESIFPAEPTECVSYGTVIPGTLTGNSDTADYKDTVLADFSDYVQVSNCGTVKVIKETDPDGLSGTFPYTLDQYDGGDLNYADPPDDEITGILTTDGDYDLIEDLIYDTDYQLVEGDVGSAFTLSSIICQVGDNTPVDITEGGTFAVEPSTTTTCTITNEQQPGTLIVKKLVINDDGGTKFATDFSFQVGTDAPVAFLTDPDQDPANPLMGKNSLSVDPGTYTVTEPAVAGYTTSYNNCSSVVVSAGGSATCIITNDDNSPRLKLVKSVTNDDGGNAVPHDWELTATGSTLGFTDYGDSTTFHNVKAGVEYTLSESSVTGYTQSGDWSCDGGSFTSPDKITLGLDQDVTCTVTNNDVAPTLKLVKNVTNDNGGTNVAADWTLTAAASAPDDGRNYSHPGNYSSFEAVFANIAYTLGETGPSSPSAEYTAGTWSCDKGVVVTDGAITLTEGQTEVTCSITNNDEKALPTGATTMSWVIYDKLTITGIRPGASGASVIFRLYSDDACTIQVGADSTDTTIVGGVAESSGFTVGAGTYYWRAFYSGDAYNMGFATRCGYEVTTVSATITLPWDQ